MTLPIRKRVNLGTWVQPRRYLEDADLVLNFFGKVFFLLYEPAIIYEAGCIYFIVHTGLSVWSFMHPCKNVLDLWGTWFVVTLVLTIPHRATRLQRIEPLNSNGKKLTIRTGRPEACLVVDDKCLSISGANTVHSTSFIKQWLEDARIALFSRNLLFHCSLSSRQRT